MIASSKRIEYEGFVIVAKMIPQDQFDKFYDGKGFGWGVQAFLNEGNPPDLAVVAKSTNVEPTQEYIDTLYQMSLSRMLELIDGKDYSDKYLCFEWDPQNIEGAGLTQVDCDELSPGEQRSPFP